MASDPGIVVASANGRWPNLREERGTVQNLASGAFEGICISENGKIIDVTPVLENVWL